MRILQVRFKNLNSLVGEWQIDLTHPAFESDGIFAITGPTGAGKTTILDAVCLALYGRTPRLNRVSRSENEIMSRQTGECFAEVTFETQSGRYRCHWSQFRARGEPDGELKAPKHEMPMPIPVRFSNPGSKVWPSGSSWPPVWTSTVHPFHAAGPRGLRCVPGGTE